jgi:hypothetical protein
MNLAERLSLIVHEQTRGNSKKFADETSINPTTLHYYLKGRLPKADALENISKIYKVNLNWLVSGIGPKYLTEHKEKQPTERSIVLLDEWLKEFKKEDPRNEAWFERELERKFPEYKEWQERKNETDGYNSSISKVA